VKRALQLSFLIGIALTLNGLPSTQASMSLQQAVTEEVLIVPLPVPTNLIGTNVRGASNDGKRLVFESINDYNGRNLDSNTEIWVYDVDSRSVIQITDTADLRDPDNPINLLLEVRNTTPVISGDGTRIAFISNASLVDPKNEDGNFEIYVADLPRGATTPTIRRITDTGPDFEGDTVKEIVTNYAPSISDDGQVLTFLSTRRFFRPIPDGPAAFTALNEGPDGTTPDGNAEVLLYHFSTRQFTQVTATRDQDATANFTVRGFNTNPILSGNGQSLVFLSGFNFSGPAAGKNADFNGELFVHRIGDPVNRVLQVTETSGRSAVPFNGPENLLVASTKPFNFDGTKLVFESSGDFVGKNADKTRELYLADLSGPTPVFRQITNQQSVDFARSDFNFLPSINAPGTHISFTSTLNLTPATTSGVKVDNADGSREIFRYTLSDETFRQLTFTPASDQFFDQRDNRTTSYLNNTGDLVTFSYDTRSLYTTGPVVIDLFQALLRPVIATSTDEVKMVNAASFDDSQVARGSLVSIFGTNLSSVMAQAGSTNLPFELGGVTVSTNSFVARLIYVSPTQINLLLPDNLPQASEMAFTVNNNGLLSNGKVRLVDASPGIFTVAGDGKGPAAAQCGKLSADGLTFPLTAPPCDVGNESQFHTLVIYATGIRNSLSVQVKVGDATFFPSYSGPQQQFPGLDQINIGLSRDLAEKQNLEISIVTTNLTTVESNKSTVSFLPYEPPVTVINAASFDTGLVARGSLAILQGTELTTTSAVASGPELPFELAGVRVTVGGQPARLEEVKPNEIRIVVPEALQLADLVEVAVFSETKVARGRVKILDAFPGIFSSNNDGLGNASALCGTVAADGTVTFSNPPCAVGTAERPNLLRVFGTGWRFAEKIDVKIGETDLMADTFGPQPGDNGRDQLDIKLVPGLAGRVDADLTLTTTTKGVAQISRFGIKISFRPAN
jgi:uncharacterized protein (TIGR03437 family)